MKRIIIGVLILFLLFPIRAYGAEEVPEDLEEYFIFAGKEFNICPELLEAIAYYESRFTPDAKNGSHYGLMQINVKIHADRMKKYGWTKEDMFSPEKNIIVAADYLSELYEEYGDNAKVLAHYSGNSKAVKKGYLCKYAKKVLKKSYEYEQRRERKCSRSQILMKE